MLVGFALLITCPLASGSETIGPEMPALLPVSVTSGSETLANALAIDGQEPDFSTAMSEGEFWLTLRYRFEQVDQVGFAKNAYASTLRTAIGYKTQSWKGFTGLIELEDVQVIGDENYNNTMNGVNRPIVADPEGGELNRAQIDYATSERGKLMLGRQRISLDNQRFVGDVAWRQNHQTFDAFAAEHSFGDGGHAFAAYVDNVNGVLGNDSPLGNVQMQSLLFNVGMEFAQWCDATAYYYDLDYNTLNALSTATVGLRVAGKIGDKNKLLYTLEYADQSDSGNNPTTVDADYSLVEVGAQLGGIKLLVANEVLGGSTTGPSFTTPLATLHKFNGWADKFLITPLNGLDDTYVSIGGKAGKVALAAIYHMFEADIGGGDYGDEIDLLATYPISDSTSVGVKYADYAADGFATDTQKLWFWLSCGI